MGSVERTLGQHTYAIRVGNGTAREIIEADERPCAAHTRATRRPRQGDSA
jgi:hypothetical protein